jgi:flavin reductase (DIM6/NTAB) family NADH-FMN oxidoreductase RutF
LRRRLMTSSSSVVASVASPLLLLFTGNSHRTFSFVDVNNSFSVSATSF